MLSIMRTTQSIAIVVFIIDWVRVYGVDGQEFDFVGFNSSSLFSIRRCWLALALIHCC